jgi:hypothetical protein
MGMIFKLKEIRNDVRKHIYNDKLKKRAEMMFWHWKKELPNFADTNDEVKYQMKLLKMCIKNKWKIVRPNLCSTHTLDNEEWYSLVFQLMNKSGELLEEDNCVCPLSASVFGYFVSTEVYWFRTKENRDTMMKYFEKLQDKAFGKKIIDDTTQITVH